ncbi:Non-specific lipid-transfer protein 8 [Stylosanthes scabra]|uniref:Non-specific lipid-transfer protein n=1 Tax=Stylosanthes scabra TaxID=79078 RepID=A0ABU6XI77_9FABA|nr:Non-specific lipid-transfer protein 8 [Stylosanthes scabra]
MKSSSSPGAVAATCVVLMIVVASFTSYSEATISSCSDVIKNLRPCVSYLVSGSGKPPGTCCSGVKALAAMASTSADKKTACNCIKSTSKSLTINSQRAQALPGNCGVSLPISVSPNADCSKIG